MPNLSLLFHVYSHGFDRTEIKTGAFIGHRESDGTHKHKFTKRHYLDACQYVKKWMCDYNASIEKRCGKQVMAPANKDRAPDTLTECGTWTCPGECKCHD